MTNSPIEEMDPADLAERGELEQSISNKETISSGIEGSTKLSNPDVVEASKAEDTEEEEDKESRQDQQTQEEHINDATGHTGCARRRQASREWLFCAACEREFCLAIDHWCYKLRRTRLAIEEHERRNREEGLEDYKEHLPNNEYGKEKERLMNQLTMELAKFGDLVCKFNGIMSQQPPRVRHLNDFRVWAWTRIADDPVDEPCGAENYRVFGRAQSTIEGLIVDAYLAITGAWYRVFYNFLPRILYRRPATEKMVVNEEQEEKVEFSFLNYSIFHIFSHLFVVSLALIFLILPLVLMYLFNLTLLGGVVMTVVFCLLFCVGSFVFAGNNINTDHKFLLLFAYTGVMATMLSKFHDGDGASGGHCAA
ncbi:hypothetical protein QBC38DRAFT_279 [Podospora fimiseda]|uniref:DUF6594 domain-containing protein n=1 Tax=Podospora fimiseda TaxID=252190 RepID=A0AAN7H8Z6_9PEZI|nr:hypothetical protein QBC38DRAFT_279 [Podospora fimiseda]